MSMGDDYPRASGFVQYGLSEIIFIGKSAGKPYGHKGKVEKISDKDKRGLAHWTMCYPMGQPKISDKSDSVPLVNTVSYSSQGKP